MTNYKERMMSLNVKIISTLAGLVVLFTLYTSELVAQETRSELVERINSFDGVEIDKFGNLDVDLGSANAGRFNIELNKSRIKLELRGEERGCADYCPERALIWFECETEDFAYDPVHGKKNMHDNAVGEFSLERGIEFNYLLTKLRYLDFIDLSKY